GSGRRPYRRPSTGAIDGVFAQPQRSRSARPGQRPRAAAGGRDRTARRGIAALCRSGRGAAALIVEHLAEHGPARELFRKAEPREGYWPEQIAGMGVILAAAQRFLTWQGAEHEEPRACVNDRGKAALDGRRGQST